jgi:hypothetical protein
MPLQNRVTPFGEILALPERGTLMGNRGVLHDDEGRIVRSWQVRRWIACRTAFRGRHRQLMQPRSWTELFFLDEATAFAAGHRPCAECRHADYLRFKAAWTVGVGAPNGANQIDAALHADRLEGRGLNQRKRTYVEELATLPDGAILLLDGSAWLLWRGRLLEWTAGGYRARRSLLPAASRVEALTPRSSRSCAQAISCASMPAPTLDAVGGWHRHCGGRCNAMHSERPARDIRASEKVGQRRLSGSPLTF